MTIDDFIGIDYVCSNCGDKLRPTGYTRRCHLNKKIIEYEHICRNRQCNNRKAFHNVKFPIIKQN